MGQAVHIKNNSQYTSSLYNELIDRLYHIERAFKMRRNVKLHYSRNIPNDVATQYLKVISKYREFFFSIEESSLWFLSVELHSRFLANSKRGMIELFSCINDQGLSECLEQFKIRHKLVAGYIKVQRDSYFTHADQKEWKDFPNVYDKEYDDLITDIKHLLKQFGAHIESKRIPTSSLNIDIETNKVFDDLLKTISDNNRVEELSIKYDKAQKAFLENNSTIRTF